MKTNKLKKLQLGMALIAVLVINTTSCDDKTFFGEILTLSGKVYTDEWDETAINFIEFTEDRKISSYLGGEGKIINGEFNFTIGTPSKLEPISKFFPYYFEDFDDFEISNKDIQAAMLSITPGQFGELFKGNFVYNTATEKKQTWTTYVVNFLYVEDDVTVTGKGKTITRPANDGRNLTYTTKNLKLQFKAGWNVFCIKEEGSKDSNDHKVVSSRRNSNPKNLKWILREGY